MTEDAVSFSFKKRDVEALLFAYNIVYFLCYYLVTNNFKLCLLIAFVFSLVNLFICAIADTFHKVTEEELKQREEEKLARKKLRDEYQRVHKLKKKIKLLQKAGCMEEDENIISAVDEPNIPAANYNNVARAVHFNYLKRYGTARLHEKDL